MTGTPRFFLCTDMRNNNIIRQLVEFLIDICCCMLIHSINVFWPLSLYNAYLKRFSIQKIKYIQLYKKSQINQKCIIFKYTHEDHWHPKRLAFPTNHKTHISNYITLHYRHFKRHLHLKWPVVHQQLHVIRNTAHRPSTQQIIFHNPNITSFW